MLNFIRKIFGLQTRPDVHPLDGATRQAQEAPYKLEPQLQPVEPSTPIQPVISNVLDVNKDGKVDVEDVKEAVKKTKKKAKEVTDEVMEKVKKPKSKKKV
jgi:hypothetical protein